MSVETIVVCMSTLMHKLNKCHTDHLDMMLDKLNELAVSGKRIRLDSDKIKVGCTLGTYVVDVILNVSPHKSHNNTIPLNVSSITVTCDKYSIDYHNTDTPYYSAVNVDVENTSFINHKLMSTMDELVMVFNSKHIEVREWSSVM